VTAAQLPTPGRPGGARRGRGRVRELVAGRSTTQRVGVVGAVLVLLTAPFGGLSSATERDVADLAFDQRLDIGPFYVTVERVSQLADLQPAVSPEPGNTLLVLRIKVTNHTDEAQSPTLVPGAFGAKGAGAVPWAGDSEVEPRLYDVDDANEVPRNELVNPDLTHTYAMVVQQRPDTDLDAITFYVDGYDLLPDAGTLQDERWVLRDRLAEGPLPVTVVP
jgi:hypothetical protein